MTPGPKGIDRRKFLKLGAAASGLALGGCGGPDGSRQDEAPREMRYRPLGGTGLRVSEVAFGADGRDNRSLISAALDLGINTFCTSSHYLDGREEEAVGEALHASGRDRDDLVLITGEALRPGASKASILESIDTSLRHLRMDHIDLLYNSMVGAPSDFLFEALFEAVDEAKRAGKLGHLGISGHSGGMQECLNAAIEDGRIEMFFFKYDFVSYPDQHEILRRAASQGIGSIVFKVGAGNRQGEIRDLEAGGLSFAQASIKWALTNPEVSSVAVRIKSFDQLRECAAAVGSKLTRNESDMLHRYAGEMYDRYCRFCGTCETACPHGVAVADVMRYAMYFKYQGREKRAMRMYAALPGPRTAARCRACAGPCEGACPFGRRLRPELAEADRLLRLSRA